MSDADPSALSPLARRLAAALCDDADLLAVALDRPDDVVGAWGLSSTDVVAAGRCLDAVARCRQGRAASRVALFRLVLACRSVEAGPGVTR